VTPGTGARFRTLAQAEDAFFQISKLNRKDIRSIAQERFSQEAVGPMFKRWFSQLESLWFKGWYS
jgi:hypothetical protein